MALAAEIENVDEVLQKGFAYARGGSDRGLIVSFYDRVVLDEAETKKQQKKCHTKALYIEIKSTHSPNHIIDRPALLDDKVDAYGEILEPSDARRFPHAYAAYQAGTSDKYNGGYPLSDWAMIPRIDAELLATYGVYTIEQLIEIPAERVKGLSTINALKVKAKNFLGQNDFTSQIAAKDQQLTSQLQENEDLKRQLAESQEREQALQNERETLAAQASDAKVKTTAQGKGKTPAGDK